ncbi:MAG: enoyl-CoA hydratase [Planctomycetota bacterium]|jgi:enoyl-CoA hydratase
MDMYEIKMGFPARNALGTDLMIWLDEQLTLAGDQPVLLTGSGDAFCAGLNLKELAATSTQDMPTFLGRIDDFASRLFDHPEPTVAWINGHAIAGGCVLALCCDYRVVQRSPKTRMGLNEVALGACFPPRVLSIVKARLSAAHVHEVLLGAQLYDVDHALRLGLVDEVADDAEARSKDWLEKLAAHPRQTYHQTKRQLRTSVTEMSEKQRRRFLEVEIPIWTSAEMRQRVLAILGR